MSSNTTNSEMGENISNKKMSIKSMANLKIDSKQVKIEPVSV
jgi:hypothetical protein